MRSYFLEGLTSYAEARAALSNRLPHWVEPWRLDEDNGNPIAFFVLELEANGQVTIQADLSGHHYNNAEVVVRVLRDLQGDLGGQVTDDDDNVL